MAKVKISTDRCAKFILEDLKLYMDAKTWTQGWERGFSKADRGAL